jgi:hypothetical protein
MGYASPVPSLHTGLLSPQPFAASPPPAPSSSLSASASASNAGTAIASTSDRRPSDSSHAAHAGAAAESLSAHQRRITDLEAQNASLRHELEATIARDRQLADKERARRDDMADVFGGDSSAQSLIRHQQAEMARLEQKAAHAASMANLLQRRLHAIAQDPNGARPGLMLALRNSVAEENERLRAVIGDQNRHIEQMMATIERHQAEIAAGREQISLKISQLTELERILPVPMPQHQHQHQHAQQPSSHLVDGGRFSIDPVTGAATNERSSATMAQLIMRDQECVQLRQKVIAAHAEVRRLKGERDKLMDISNGLRAQLTAAQDAAAAAAAHAARPGTDHDAHGADERAPSYYRQGIAREKEVNRQQANDLFKLENAVRHLMVQNTQLRAEVARMTQLASKVRASDLRCRRSGLY